MRSLNSICRAREEARYVSRTWARTQPAPDVSYPLHIKATVESPDELIPVWMDVGNGMSSKVMITRAQHLAEMKAKNDEFDAKQKAKGL